MANETTDLGKFPAGANNVSKETDLPEGSLRSAENVDIDNAGNVRLRRGYQQIYSGSNIHSLYKRLFVEGSDLKYLEQDNTATLIQSSLTSNKLKYCEFNDTVFCTDGDHNWQIQNKQINRSGILPPSNNASIGISTSGAIPSGQYQVAVQFMHNVTGEFSAASDIGVIIVNPNQTIYLTNIPQPESVDESILVYISLHDGTILYHDITLNAGVTEYTVANIKQDTHSLETQNYGLLPGGSEIAYSNGRVFIAKGNMVWYSEPMWYGQTNPSHNFWQFTSNITILLALDDGIFVVADETYFIPTGKPEEATLESVDPVAGIPGTGLVVKAEHFGLDTVGDVAYWFTPRGAVLGLPDGSIKFLSETRLSVPQVSSGASMYTESDSIRQIVTSMNKTGGTRSKVGANDSATIQIIRNGVEV